MAFVLHELDNGERTGRFVLWDAGTLTGDEELITDLRLTASEYEGVYLGTPENPSGATNHLSNGVSVQFLAYAAWGTDWEAVGDVPFVGNEPGRY